MMAKQLVITKLDDEQIEKLNSIMNVNNSNKSALLKEAYTEFVSQLPKQKPYEPKYTDFIRINLTVFNIVVMDGFSLQLNHLATKLDLSKFQLLREILINYLFHSKKKK